MSRSASYGAATAPRASATGVRDDGAVSKKRGSETAADMIRSLGLVMALVAAGLLLGPARELVMPTESRVREVRVIDPSAEVGAAARAAEYDVLAPTGLPDTWRSTSARVLSGPRTSGGTVGLQVGYVTPSEEYATVAESDGANFFADRVGARAEQLEDVRIGARLWRQWRTSRGEIALTVSDRPRLVIVTGSAPLAELKQLAGSLRPVPGDGAAPTP